MEKIAIIQMTDEKLDMVVGGADGLRGYKFNSTQIILQNMSLNAPTTGRNNAGGLVISVVQGIN